MLQTLMGSIVAIGVWENKGTKGLNLKLLFKVAHSICMTCSNNAIVIKAQQDTLHTHATPQLWHLELGSLVANNDGLCASRSLVDGLQPWLWLVFHLGF